MMYPHVTLRRSLSYRQLLRVSDYLFHNTDAHGSWHSEIALEFDVASDLAAYSLYLGLKYP